MMQPSNKTLLRVTTDASGAEVAHVAISGGHVIQMDKPDFERLSERCGHAAWFLNYAGRTRGYPTMDMPSVFGDDRKAPTALARIIVSAGARERVRYDNGDRLDLRRTNLRIVGGRGKYGGLTDTGSGLENWL